MVPYAIAVLFGGLVKVTEYEKLKYLAVGYFVVSLLFGLAFGQGENLGPLVLVLAVKSLLVYGWVILLYKAEDTIFTYLFLLVGGTILLGIF